MHKYKNIVKHKTITAQAFGAIFNLFPREVGRRNDEEEKEEKNGAKNRKVF